MGGVIARQNAAPAIRRVWGNRTGYLILTKMTMHVLPKRDGSKEFSNGRKREGHFSNRIDWRNDGENNDGHMNERGYELKG